MKDNNFFSFFKNKHFLSLGGNLSSSILSFITFGMLARVLTKGTFGDWLTFLAGFAFFETFRTSTIQTPFIKFYSGVQMGTAEKIAEAAWDMGLRLTLMSCLSSFLLFLILYLFKINNGWLIFSIWFPLFFITSYPYNYATWILQAKGQFREILILRIILNGSFLTGLLLIFIVGKLNLITILYAYFASCFFTSGLSILMKWSPLWGIFTSDKKAFSSIFGLGKYIMFTGISSNLLKSSDTFILNLTLGPQAVAIYSTPQKIIEIIDLPLRSLVATVIPTMANYLNKNDEKGASKLFLKFSGMMTWILIPVVGIILILAPYMIVLIGGKGYANSANILRIFILFSALLPIDRFLGVTLDIIGKPSMNLIKVILMLITNILGDFLGIFIFHNVESVAASSILTFLTGILFGHRVLRKYLPYKFLEIFKDGLKELKIWLGKPFNNLN